MTSGCPLVLDTSRCHCEQVPAAVALSIRIDHQPFRALSPPEALLRSLDQPVEVMDVYLEASGQADGRKCSRPDEPPNGGDGDSQDDRRLLQGQETAGFARGDLWRDTSIGPMLSVFQVRRILIQGSRRNSGCAQTVPKLAPVAGFRRVRYRQIDMVFVARSPPR